MTAYAEVVGGTAANEIPAALPYILSTGEQIAANWLNLNDDTQKAAKNIYPITDDATPGIEYTVTGSTLQVGGGGVTVQRHWTTTAKTAAELKNEIEAEIDAWQERYSNTLFWWPAGTTPGDYANGYDCNAVACQAIIANGIAAAASGGAADDYQWNADPAWSGANFYYYNSISQQVNFDAIEAVDFMNVLGLHKWKMMQYRRDLRSRAQIAGGASDIATLLAIHLEAADEANWLAFSP